MTSTLLSNYVSSGQASNGFEALVTFGPPSLSEYLCAHGIPINVLHIKPTMDGAEPRPGPGEGCHDPVTWAVKRGLHGVLSVLLYREPKLIRATNLKRVLELGAY